MLPPLGAAAQYLAAVVPAIVGGGVGPVPWVLMRVCACMLLTTQLLQLLTLQRELPDPGLGRGYLGSTSQSLNHAQSQERAVHHVCRAEPHQPHQRWKHVMHAGKNSCMSTRPLWQLNTWEWNRRTVDVLCMIRCRARTGRFCRRGAPVKL